MLGALIIVFREVIEAGLIVGIVMAATRGVPGRGRWVTIGIAAGMLGAAIVAMFAGVISDAFQGSGQELFNAGVLGVAVVMLMWHNAWMARHGREIADEMQRVGTAVSEGTKPLTALAIVVGLAVLREGSEVVLFLYGIMASGNIRVCPTHRRRARYRSRRRFLSLDVFRPAGDSEPSYLFCHELAHRIACRGHGGTICPVSQQRGSRRRPGSNDVGHVLAPVRGQYSWPHAARPNRIHGTADGDAASRLRRHLNRDVHFDADCAPVAAQTDARCR